MRGMQPTIAVECLTINGIMDYLHYWKIGVADAWVEPIGLQGHGAQDAEAYIGVIYMT